LLIEKPRALVSGPTLQTNSPAPTIGKTREDGTRSLSLGRVSAKTEGKENMKRRDFLKVGGVGLAATTVASPAIAQSNPEIKWRLAASWPKALDTLYGGCEHFSKRVA